MDGVWPREAPDTFQFQKVEFRKKKEKKKTKGEKVATGCSLIYQEHLIHQSGSDAKIDATHITGIPSIYKLERELKVNTLSNYEDEHRIKIHRVQGREDQSMSPANSSAAAATTPISERTAKSAKPSITEVTAVSSSGAGVDEDKAGAKKWEWCCCKVRLLKSHSPNILLREDQIADYGYSAIQRTKQHTTVSRESVEDVYIIMECVGTVDTMLWDGRRRELQEEVGGQE